MSFTSITAKLNEEFRKRVFVFIGIIFISFMVLIIQVFRLQVVYGEEYKLKAKINMEDYVPIISSRGEMYDRNFSLTSENNHVIASNRPSFNLTLIRAKFEDDSELEKCLFNLSRIIDINYTEVFNDIKSKNKWEHCIIKEDVPFEKIVNIASHQHLYPHIKWEDVPVRVYNYSEMFSHVVGYIGSINKDEYNEYKNKGYKYYHKLGKYGLEKQYDALLRGVDGNVRRIVDVKNRTEGEEIGKEPVAGNNLVLTIDYNIQKAAYEALQDYVGTVIVMRADTGEIISLASNPGFNPNVIIAKNNDQVFQELQNDKNKPFLNRAIQTRYPPASTFKLVTAIAALEEGKWNPNTLNYCPGYYILKGFVDTVKQCYKGTAHGVINMYQAIGESCNVYFYNVGYKIGPTPIMKYAEYFGLNEKTGIDLPGEVTGFVPSQKWKRRIFGQSWYDGDTVNLAIGQGFISVTPVEMASFVSGIANNGVIYKPYLIKEIRSQDNMQIIQEQKREKIKEIPLSGMTLNTVKTGMRMSVTSGTSVRLNYLKVPIAGKTGSAQTRSSRKDESTQHAWFVGFAPYSDIINEKYVVAVLIERGVAGAATAVPVAEKMFYTMQSMGYFDDEKQQHQ
ncbi:MAG: penicillin-binding protein 2 [Spirochaetes bacterium]|nr:penicillin-binding protein 2 [Spirochaetota bacterium]